ncbi:prepilin peptidase [Enterobacter hormaechei]|uniref:prepilin peptidase n=1 Tax=Enterobacter hormaechei TaxID=158836 RepID=UPI0007971896|nr:prepilin peptidase [Enterobacter hormaechei]CZV48502.1 Uncharacterised protein [Enterobacter hormaechei]
MLWIGFYSIALAVVGKLFADYLPYVYQTVKMKVIEDNKLLESEELKTNSYPLVSVLMFMSAIIVYILTDNLYLSFFVFAFACVAYTDLVMRWVPDILIYLLAWISLIDFTKSIDEGILSIVMFCLPALVIYLYTYVINRHKCISSGDWYVIPSVGLWLSPDLAASYMAVCIIMVAITSRYTKDVPLLTCLFPVFVGGQLCEFYYVF